MRCLPSRAHNKLYTVRVPFLGRLGSEREKLCRVSVCVDLRVRSAVSREFCCSSHEFLLIFTKHFYWGGCIWATNCCVTWFCNAVWSAVSSGLGNCRFLIVSPVWTGKSSWFDYPRRCRLSFWNPHKCNHVLAGTHSGKVHCNYSALMETLGYL